MKMKPVQKRIGWTDEHNQVIVAAYFGMLQKQINGVKFVKAHLVRELAEYMGRSKASVECKFMNISAIVAENGINPVKGYKPLDNYNSDLVPLVWAACDTLTGPSIKQAAGL